MKGGCIDKYFIYLSYKVKYEKKNNYFISYSVNIFIFRKCNKKGKCYGEF